MWNIGSFSHHTPVGPQSQFSTRPIKKMSFMPESRMSFPNSFGIQQINMEKKFVNPNFVNKEPINQIDHKTGHIYEKCSKFINKSNGYPNNIRKDHISPVDLQPEAVSDTNITITEPGTSYPILIDLKTTLKSILKQKNNKKVRARKSWHSQYSMELLDIDEIGIDVCNDLSYLQVNKMDKPTIFVETKSSSDSIGTSPINCISRQVCTEIFKTLSSSPICFKIQTPVFFSISPPHAMGIPIRNKICEGFRKRLPSDCASEDSFIMFEEDSGDDMSEKDDDSCSDSAEESDEDIDFPDNDCLVDDTMKTDTDKSNLKFIKKVHFADPKDLLEVHPMIKWSYAYQAARKGPWELYARDRERFKNRITQSSNILSRVLNPDHRRYIYDMRFREDTINEA